MKNQKKKKSKKGRVKKQQFKDNKETSDIGRSHGRGQELMEDTQQTEREEEI